MDFGWTLYIVRTLGQLRFLSLVDFWVRISSVDRSDYRTAVPSHLSGIHARAQNEDETVD